MADKAYRPVKKAVFPVAGLGTRFLPATKDIPKEMMPLVDRPLIHHGVDEAVASGCTEVVFVTGQGKESIRRYFEPSDELVSLLRERGKEELAAVVENIHSLADFYYAFQEKPLGLGHAVLCAEEFCKDEYFGLLLPDDVMIAEPPVLSQLETVRKKYNSSVLCVEQVAESEVSRYGIVDAEEVEPGIYRVRGLVEKPERGDAPSNLAIMGRYLLSPNIFRHLRELKRGAGGEYQLTDAISSLLNEEPVYAALYSGKRLDCGVKEGWIKATVVKALEDPELREIVLAAVRESGLLMR
ncbi:UTP--glucose-1-phosphate uridylyltransferase [Cloacibacillus evryensis]|uniref:UTP--glucose-1-phosphate uridylyltransferase n=1 Tax=Cloacibacillus evryensis TaxID=508460 RepID=A0AAW5K9G8_9BACT|nr:UTP--glucose-1-phosphate uridylyltransferase [Cloacibacillus evryensis]EHL69082.1 UTP-glucose-1-phosphate uridylyltransferase [Synergistes sp. 3_1_syn1]MCQ4763181.1 UTP--glucose-1-phosphate uridylyltransferase [Cloacibacillus evryensis]MCQ4815408.1 UTP--glucose-1-phosphate uridylyltransferase [Cloacibacillus evryensis]